MARHNKPDCFHPIKNPAPFSNNSIHEFTAFTNLAAGISPIPLSHGEVIEAGKAAGPRISALLAKIVERI